MTIEDLVQFVDDNIDDDAKIWLDETLASIDEDPTVIRSRFPMTTRKVGKPADLAARILMISRLSNASDEIEALYKYGDTNERIAVLSSLDYLDLDASVKPIVADALRTNDANLVTAALGAYALQNLSADELRHAIMKCVFLDISFDQLPPLDQYATPELSAMLGAFVLERIAAGRTIHPDVWPLIDAYPPTAELAAIKAELQSKYPDRREAASGALALRKTEKEA